LLPHTSAKSPAPLAFCRFFRQFNDREKSVVVPQSKPPRPRKILGAFDRHFSPETARDPSGGSSEPADGSSALSSLKDLIAAGDQRLDPMLATITDAARQLTGATGAALAMWKEGVMVCRARSGDTAPPLGARLSADTGISGECLRTGKIHHCADTENDPLVDVEVCRTLGLRSIAVLPIQGWRGINGILEVFSTKPSAFSEQHIATLQQLAALAERARATQPHGASALPPRTTPLLDSRQPSALLPASDRVGDVALAFVDRRSRPFVLGAIGLLAISLLALVIWLGWRGPNDANGKAQAATPVLANASTANPATAPGAMAHPPDNDLVWKPNPGGETLFASSGKPSAGSPVKFASDVEMVVGTKAQPRRSPADRSPLLADLADKVAPNAAIPHGDPNLQSGSQTPSKNDPKSDEGAMADPPMITTSVTGQSALNGVLTAKASLPGLSAPVSLGVSGGQLVHRVAPVYPAQARLLRQQGTVILAATVMEDGSVREVKVVQGSPVFAQSAMDAVKSWRYKPYQLDGKPVKNEIRINVDFRFPSH
jgi:TonB family protein